MAKGKVVVVVVVVVFYYFYFNTRPIYIHIYYVCHLNSSFLKSPRDDRSGQHIKNFVYTCGQTTLCQQQGIIFTSIYDVNTNN